MADSTTVLIVLAAASFLPPLIFLGWVRRQERYGREPWHRVLRTFVWGSIFAVILALLLSVLLFLVFQEVDRVWVLSGRFPSIELIVLAVIIAPFTEEFAKGVGVYLARPMIDEPEDGLVYGAASGFGFSSTETLLYGLAALVAPGGGFEASLVLIGIRSISSSLLHASASATFGYGIAASRLWPAVYRVFPYYLGAVAMHAGFNLLAVWGELSAPSYGELVVIATLGAGVSLAIIAFALVRAKIAKEDERRVAW